MRCLGRSADFFQRRVALAAVGNVGADGVAEQARRQGLGIAGLQLAVAGPGSDGFLPPEHYDQIFTAHGVIMIFFVATPFIVGLMNIVVPLQIGARDMAFPFLNAFSFWVFVVGAVLVMLGEVFREVLEQRIDQFAPLSRNAPNAASA